MNTTENILKCLLENLDVGVQVLDIEGKTIYYNEAMSKVEGFNISEVLGKKVTEYLEGVGEDTSTLMNALKTGEKYVDIIQHYSSFHRKEIVTINNTIPVINDNKVLAAIEISKDLTQLKELNEKIIKLQAINDNNSKYYTFKDIIGESSHLKAAINKAKRASFSHSSVLINGETGCGKELFAQSIHYDGIRKDKPFIAINCAAIPSSLLEGLLFGTVKGSFTGAENKKGIFEEADGGTLLLDEINSLEPSLQSKLLRVLQEGYIMPIGSNVAIDVDVRVIATLNEEPEKLIKEGKLRKDFYYRLSVIRIDIPPLRERKEDINLLIKDFIKKYNKLLHKNILDIDEEVRSMFMDYSWPGNIRELRNIIESAMNMVDNAAYLTKEYLDSRILKMKGSSTVDNFEFNLMDKGLDDYLSDLEVSIIEDALNKFNNNITKAALYLKISRQSLQHKLKKYKLP
jgi:arginine utilization regulatory protein